MVGTEDSTYGLREKRKRKDKEEVELRREEEREGSARRVKKLRRGSECPDANCTQQETSECRSQPQLAKSKSSQSTVSPLIPIKSKAQHGTLAKFSGENQTTLQLQVRGAVAEVIGQLGHLAEGKSEVVRSKGADK